MPVNAIDGNAIEQLRQQLMQVFDRDRNGSLNGSEFADILLGLVKDRSLVNLGGGQPGGAPRAVATTGRAATPAAFAPLEGFDHTKLATSSSPKYLFARVAMQYDLSEVQNKSAAEGLLQRMRPDLEQAGLNILDVAGDRIKIRHEDREVWVDVIRAASVGARAYQWLPDA